MEEMNMGYMRLPLVVAMALASGTAATAQQPIQQTQTDDYTRYELQGPETHSFRILYDLSATAAGAPYYFNTIRRGSTPTVHAVTDLMTGSPLEWQLIPGEQARAAGHVRARDDTYYIQVMLARAVPNGGQARIRIDKTYEDTASYYTSGEEIVFSRTLGIRRNSVVLPEGYELVAVSYPSQVVVEDDGRIKVSFMNPGPAGVPYTVRARPLSKRGMATDSPAPSDPRSPATTQSSSPTGARLDYQFSERAFQDRDIVYFLEQPETHAFRLYHDYTETRTGVDRYLNVVRAGSKASNPSAKILDTGEELQVETLRGVEITGRGVDIGRAPTNDTEVVVIWFDAVPERGSVRLRIEETYTDPNRYLLNGDELVWDRSFGRARNTVILPDGWYLTANAIPAVVDLTEDGRVRLRYINERPGGIDVFIKARRR
jgi:hypothetical protein